MQNNQDQEEFDNHVLRNAQRDKRHAVCLRCAARGFSTRDVEPYPCMECGELGHLSFARQTLDNHKRRSRRMQLVCTQCCTRHDAIEAKLKDKKAIRCTCRGQQHSYANEKCKLFPEKNWGETLAWQQPRRRHGGDARRLPILEEATTMLTTRSEAKEQKRTANK